MYVFQERTQNLKKVPVMKNELNSLINDEHFNETNKFWRESDEIGEPIMYFIVLEEIEYCGAEIFINLPLNNDFTHWLTV